MSTTRTRLISLGLIRPHTLTDDDRKASQLRAIAARRIELQRSINISHARKESK